MSHTQSELTNQKSISEFYKEAEHWHLNTGKKIYAKRIPGKWRRLKCLSASVWLIFFIGYFFRWGERQAVLFDIPNRQFHFFGITILPQDFWMLSLTLLFFAILLAITTALAGRIYCGFFCFQTIWTDIFTWIEEKIEGNPSKRRKLDTMKFSFLKLRTKLIKHIIWLFIGFITGVSFVSWFYDGLELWKDMINFNVVPIALIFISLFTIGTYLLAGFLREQTCFWLCPYARIQGTMIDNTTKVITYNIIKGEPRSHLKKRFTKEGYHTDMGNCIDCKQCIAVCPTGIDIRHGQQEGCINCALCIDACNAVMSKLGWDQDLICYASLDELKGLENCSMWQRPRVWIYSTIMILALLGIIYGIKSLDTVELKVLHDRQPLFIIQSDGSIQNKYTLKILNKLSREIKVYITVSGIDNMVLLGADKIIKINASSVKSHTVFVRVPENNVEKESQLITFHIAILEEKETLRNQRESIFISPKNYAQQS